MNPCVKISIQESLSVLDGVTFVKQNETANAEDSPSIVEGRFLNGLSTVDKALISNLDRFFKTHVLKVDMAEARGKIQDKLQEIKEKRGTVEFPSAKQFVSFIQQI